MGFDGIEFSGIRPHDGSAPEEYAQKLAAECQARELTVANYNMGVDFCKDLGGLDAAVEKVKRNVDLAVILGAPSMRHDATTGVPGKTFAQLLPVLAEGCRRAAEYAQSKNVVTTVENHGYCCQDSTRLEQLYSQTDHPNFGLLVDMGNFLCADENPVEAVGRLAGLARFVHAKDFIVKDGGGANPGTGFFTSRAGNYLRGTIVGQGNVPVFHCLRILKRNGYNGWLSIEFEGMEDALQAIKIGLDNLRAYAAMI
jgi:sugar phosphate isomerase/epimerase